MTAASHERCARCRFWREDERQSDANEPEWGFGDCRRRPPRIVEAMATVMLPKAEYRRQVELEPDSVDRQQMTWFPATFATDWCGEFEEVGAREPIA